MPEPAENFLAAAIDSGSFKLQLSIDNRLVPDTTGKLMFPPDYNAADSPLSFNAALIDGEGPQNLRAVRISGTDMRPEIKQHDILIVDIRRNLPCDIHEGGLYMIAVKDGNIWKAVPRYVEWHDRENEVVIYGENNRRVKPVIRDIGDVTVLGTVIGVVRLFTGANRKGPRLDGKKAKSAKLV
jgi:hypothetical protein